MSFQSFKDGWAGRSWQQGRWAGGLMLLGSLLAGTRWTPAQESSECQVDLQRIFYAAPAQVADAEADLKELLASLASLRGEVSTSGAALLEALRQRDALQREFEKLDAFLYLSWARDTSNDTLQDKEQRLGAAVEAGLSSLQAEIGAIPDKRLEELKREAPALSGYGFALEKMQRLGPHHRSSESEALLSSLEPQLSGWQEPLYREVFSATSFEPVLMDGASLDPYRDRSALRSSADPVIRREAFRRLYEGLEKNRNLVAFTLNRLASAGNARAAMHHFEDAAEEAYATIFLSKAEVQGILTQIASTGDSYKELQRVEASRARKALGLSEVHVWDLSASKPTLEPKFSFVQARSTLLEALAPLGEGYRSEMAALLDPASGRSDIGAGKNRKPGGFSLGFPSFPSVFFAGQFHGSYNDMRVMVHEAGHAVHRELMRSAGVPPDYARGPNFLFESFASLNELLLAEYLSDHAADSGLRRYYLEQYLDGKATAAYSVAPEAELEQEIYERVARNGPLTADELDTMTITVYSKYSIWPLSTPELKRQWQVVPLLYEDPFYDLNYVYAGLLALKYEELLRADPQGFSRSYLALLKNGFDAPPADLLRRFLGIDLRSPTLVLEGQRILTGKLQKLKES